jgi:DNA-binding IclR family transcriptional regulator
VEKAIDVLLCFDVQQPQLRLTDISRRLGLHKSTVHRLLAVLKKKGLVVADASSQLYSLGPALVELAWVILRQQDLRSVCRPHMEELRRLTRETVSLHIRLGDKRVCVEELESEQEVRFAATLGLAAPVHVGAPGKALLAFLPEAELERLLPTLSLTAITAETITEAGVLRAELAATRARGYAISVGERSPWAAAVAAPIFDWRGQLCAALSVAGPTQRLTAMGLEALGAQIVEAAAKISAALGYRAP